MAGRQELAALYTAMWCSAHTNAVCISALVTPVGLLEAVQLDSGAGGAPEQLRPPPPQAPGGLEEDGPGTHP